MSPQISYELLVNDEWQAEASGPGALAEIMHYAEQYSEDGPVTIFKVTRKEIAFVKRLNDDPQT